LPHENLFDRELGPCKNGILPSILYRFTAAGNDSVRITAGIVIGLKCLNYPRAPELEAQRAAMCKLAFLTGDWIAEARLLRGLGESVVFEHLEDFGSLPKPVDA
jgi:hypothetical protein